MPKTFDETQKMLSLAALSYRGFEDVLDRAPHLGRLGRAIGRGLAELAPICGTWTLAWGPVAYRAPFSVVDDDLMFVARSGDAPHRYVVVVRGTNPVSAFDWLFGDFWVGETVPWPYAPAAGAAVSLSALLGLNVLQLMQSPAPPQGLIDEAWDAVVGRVSDAVDVVRAVLRPLSREAATEVRAVRERLLPVLAQLDTVRRARKRHDPVTQILGLTDDWRSASRRYVLEHVMAAAGVLSAEHSFNLLRFLEGSARLEATLAAGGTTLLAFLGAAVAAAGGAPVEVVVTGHSKGGALASTLALWLADTQGEPAGQEDFRWDPKRRATVHCWSYAGPTAGNDAFAAHSEATLGPRCHRVYNALDVVPHAWATGDLGKIPGLYRHAPPARALEDLLDAIVGDVARHAYTHPGVAVPLHAREQPALRGFLPQLVHQHLAGYLEALALDEVDLLTFFGPLA